MFRFMGIFHDAHGGLGRVATKNSYETSVGSEAISIEIVEIDALVS